VAAALANPARVCRRLLVTKAARDRLANAASALAERSEPRLEVVERAMIEARLPPGAVHQGVAIEVAPLVPPSLDEACAPTHGGDGDRDIVVVLDQVTDPRNVGAALRAAAAFGTRTVILPARHAPPESGALAKAASGALDLVALTRVVNLARALGDLKDMGYWCVGLDAEAEATPEAIPASVPLALVLGAEGAGLRRLTRERCDLLVRLPMTGAVASLNVAAATAVALYAVTARASD